MNAVLCVVLAPLLAAGATLGCRRWGLRAGGILSAFPAVVGPLLLLVADQHGAAAAALAANGALLGLVALAGFALAYGSVAARAGWCVSLVIAWICAAALASLIGLLRGSLDFPAGLLAAAIFLAAAHRLMPAVDPARSPTASPGSPSKEIALRMVATAALVMALGGAVDAFGPWVGGALAGLPTLASVLAAFTHHRQGATAAVELLRGMLVGMAGFAGFCATGAALVVPAGVAAAFTAATLVAAVLQLGSAWLGSASHRPMWGQPPVWDGMRSRS